LQNEREMGSGILWGYPSPRVGRQSQTEKPRRRPSAGVSFTTGTPDQNLAPTETVTVAGAAQPWKNTVGSDCVR
jgi:hypothetical protein